MKTIDDLRTWCAANPDELIFAVNSPALYNELTVWRHAVARMVYTCTGQTIHAYDMDRGRDILAQLNQLNADAAVESVAADYRLYL